MSAYEFLLPLPPSVNVYWRSLVMGNRAIVCLSKEGREYKDKVRDAVAKACKAAGIKTFEYYKERQAGKSKTKRKSLWFGEPGKYLFSGRVAVSLMVCPKSGRVSDIDNYSKASLDAFTSCGLWEDDSQVDILYIVRGQKVRGGALRAHIREIDTGRQPNLLDL